MQVATVFFLLAGFYGSFILAIPVSINGHVSVNLNPVAVVDGKTFFADKAVLRTWKEAAKFCSDSGMNLADIATQAEADALRMAYEPNYFNEKWGFWTSGRDAHLPRQFTWNTTGGDHSSIFNNLGGAYLNLPYQTCLFYWSKPNNASNLYWNRCDVKSGTLCSTRMELCN